jgi:hypothetical protein
MLQSNKLKGKIYEKGLNIALVSQRIGMNVATFYRKLAKNTFSLIEVENITKVLQLTQNEAIDIFFGNQGAEMHQEESN